jgi:hypothetical protein
VRERADNGVLYQVLGFGESPGPLRKPGSAHRASGGSERSTQGHCVLVASFMPIKQIDRARKRFVAEDLNSCRRGSLSSCLELSVASLYITTGNKPNKPTSAACSLPGLVQP